MPKQPLGCQWVSHFPCLVFLNHEAGSASFQYGNFMYNGSGSARTECGTFALIFSQKWMSHSTIMCTYRTVLHTYVQYEYRAVRYLPVPYAYIYAPPLSLSPFLLLLGKFFGHNRFCKLQMGWKFVTAKNQTIKFALCFALCSGAQQKSESLTFSIWKVVSCFPRAASFFLLKGFEWFFLQSSLLFFHWHMVHLGLTWNAYLPSASDCNPPRFFG